MIDESPTLIEWCLIYAPLGAALIAACAIDCSTGRIPNALSYTTLLYAIGARAVIGPQPFLWYLFSLVMAAKLAYIVGWGGGYLGGGAAKLAIAVAAALPPELFIAATLVLMSFLAAFIATHRWHGREEMPGSVAVAAAASSVIAMAAVWGHVAAGAV